MTTLSQRIALLTAATLLALTGCTADADTSTDTPPSPSSSEPTQSTEKAKPAKSEPAIKVNAKSKDRPVQEVSGIVSWEVQPGKGLNAAQAKKISAAADAFIDEHLLRPDRWRGKHIVKTGEMDDVKAKYTTRMYGLVEPDIYWWDANVEEHGPDPADWPKKQAAQANDRARSMGGMFVTQVLTEGGKGPIENEVTRRVVYLGDDPGEILAYVAVTGFRVNNTGTRKSITAKLTFKQVNSRWLIDGVYWETV